MKLCLSYIKSDLLKSIKKGTKAELVIVLESPHLNELRKIDYCTSITSTPPTPFKKHADTWTSACSWLPIIPRARMGS